MDCRVVAAPRNDENPHLSLRAYAKQSRKKILHFIQDDTRKDGLPRFRWSLAMTGWKELRFLCASVVKTIQI